MSKMLQLPDFVYDEFVIPSVDGAGSGAGGGAAENASLQQEQKIIPRFLCEFSFEFPPEKRQPGDTGDTTAAAENTNTNTDANANAAAAGEAGNSGSNSKQGERLLDNPKSESLLGS